MQRNWIGKSSGIFVDFPLVVPPGVPTSSIRVYTKKPETLCGATFIAVANDHSILSEM
jgi:leucyl-tRNA synthetase